MFHFLSYSILVENVNSKYHFKRIYLAALSACRSKASVPTLFLTSVLNASGVRVALAKVEFGSGRGSFQFSLAIAA